MIIPNKVFNVSNGILPHPLAMADATGFVSWMDMRDIDMLLEAYKFGMFPWEGFAHLGAFYFPPRRYMVEPSEVKIAKSMRPYFNQKKFDLSFDQAFWEVINSCQRAKRKHQYGTWISDIFLQSYQALHERGYAHSVEVWQGDYLVGGLYGVSIGKIFVGESMFSAVSNSSKFAMISLSKYLESLGFHFIDCQVYNPYVASFGGGEINSQAFFEIMKDNYFEDSLVGNWGEMFRAVEVG